jgi:hypothetical protein
MQCNIIITLSLTDFKISFVKTEITVFGVGGGGGKAPARNKNVLRE